MLYIRGKDDLGRWGNTYAHAFSTTSTGLGEHEVISWFKLYPNPGKGHLRLEFSEKQTSPLKIVIRSINGQTVYSNKQKNNISELDVHLTKGLYFFGIESKTRTFTQKIIIE